METPPFEPRVDDGIIYARGASDDKGQVYAHIKALEAYVRTGTELPVNVKFIIEGEEECGGHSIYRYTEQNPEKLACDAVIISDTTLYNETTPGICYSLKGLAYMEIRVKGPDKDLHSGSYGGTVQNPGNALAEIVARLKDEDGRCLVPGFYDDVLDLDQEERDGVRRAGLHRRDPEPGDRRPGRLRRAGLHHPGAHVGPPHLRRQRHALSGYGGEGAKTIIPSRAMAKVSMRLVPNQDPKAIAKAFADYVKAIAPAGVEVEVIDHHGANPVLVPRKTPMMQAGMRALEQGFGAKPVFIREGGSHPHRGHLPGLPEGPGAAAGLRAVHGQHPLPQREVPPGELLARRPHHRRCCWRRRPRP